MESTSLYQRFRGWVKQYPLLAGPLWRMRTALEGLASTISDLVATARRVAFLAWAQGWLRRHGAAIPAQSAPPANALIVMLVWTYLPADPRVEREARALAEAGYRVKILCPQFAVPAPTPDWGDGIEIRYLAHDVAAPLRHFPWQMSQGFLEAALQEEAWAYHAHDLDTALTALLAAAQKRVLCVCDFNEWYSENVTYDEARKAFAPHSAVKKWLFRSIEELALRHASRVVTVCESIAVELQNKHKPPRSVAVVRNIPPQSINIESASAIDLRQTLRIADDRAILLYQGGIGPSRGLEPLLDAMGLVQHAVLVIRGPGIEHFEAEYLRRAEKAGAAGKVFCLPPVTSARCTIEARAADLGFWTLLPICKNFTYALPNKVFEYMTAGLPLVCAHHPEVARLIGDYDIGRCFDPENPRSIAQAIDELACDAQARRRCRANLARALADLRADVEWAKLVALYDGLCAAPRSRKAPADLDASRAA